MAQQTIIAVRHYLICSIVCADDFDEGDRLRVELDELPGPTGLLAAIHHLLPRPLVTRHLHAVAVGPVVAVPEQQSHGGYDVRLGQLDDDVPGAQLVACVARVPVIVSRVAVQQGIPAATHAFQHHSAGGDTCNILSGN